MPAKPVTNGFAGILHTRIKRCVDIFLLITKPVDMYAPFEYNMKGKFHAQ